jgi:hypothetical protein
MNKKIKTEIAVWIILIIAIITGGIFWLSERNVKNQINNVTKVAVPTEKKITKSNNYDTYIVPSDNMWNQYTNKRLGFSMKIPKQSFDSNSQTQVPVVVLDDGKSNSIVIDFEYSIDGKGNKKQRSFEGGGGYKIIFVNNIASEENMNKFIKKTFGNGCKLEVESKHIFNDLSKYSLGAEQNGLSKDDPWFKNCGPASSAVRFIYSPNKKRLAYLDIGQEVTFPIESDNFTYGYEREMLSSFNFN